jgi:hypothetical protein
MNYKASQHLINILLKHGFIETTQCYFPTYWKIIEDYKTYEPSTIRMFEHEKIMVLFDASDIRVSVDRHDMYKTEVFFEDELQSLLFPLVHPYDYEEYEKIIKNPVYLISYIRKLLENTDVISEQNKEKYCAIYRKIHSIEL